MLLHTSVRQGLFDDLSRGRHLLARCTGGCWRAALALDVGIGALLLDAELALLVLTLLGQLAFALGDLGFQLVHLPNLLSRCTTLGQLSRGRAELLQDFRAL
ncbi:hypothetical protein D3C78_1663670 [compost metagenome]